jgi:hypothetical protein
MANNEGVDIIIKATDQYTKTINNITASNELFGKSVKNIEKEIAALQKYMISLKVNGMDTTSVGFKILQEKLQSLNTTLNQTKNAVNGVDNALAATGNNLKKNNQQWTNLSLVIQDLPYGFRGIQNNLPALLGGFAAVTGPIYLAFSAIIAVLTVVDEKMRQSASAAKKLKDEQANLNDEILQSTQSAREQGILLKSYIDIANDATLSDNVRNEALKKANELYGDHNQKLTLANINTKAVKESVDGYIQSLIQMAVAQKYSDQVANNIIKSDKIQAKLDEKNIIRQRLTAEVRGKQTNESRDLLDVYEDLRKINKEIFDIESEQAKNVAELTTLTDKYSKSLVLATQLSAEFGKVEEKNGDGKTNASKIKVSTAYEELAQEEYNFYKDSIFRAEEYFVKLNNIQKTNALMEATIRGASAEELFTIQQTYEQKELNFRQSIEDKKFAIRQQSEERQKQLTKSYDDQKIKDQVTFTTNYIATLDAQLKAQMRLNRNNVALQQEDVKNKLIQLQFAQVFAAGNVKALEAINAAILKLKGNLTGLGDVSTTVSNILSASLQSTFEGIGQSLGELVTTGKFNFGILGTILADALISIGKALILYSSLVQAAKKAIEAGQVKAGLIIGIAAVAAGFALKASMNKKQNTGAKEFANGGIISGPTYGLMGEYPGAASNPEVVAPLDKLKSLIGGAGGTLEARISGNDLLILMNKAGRNNQNTF